MNLRYLTRAASTILLAAMPMLCLGTVAGCAWKPTIIHADPALTSRDLVSGKMTIMPVKFDTDKATPKERALMAAAFTRAALQNREDIPLASSAMHDQALQGALKEEALFMQVYDQGGADPSKLAALKQSASLNARYFVLSRLHYEQETHAGSTMGNTVQSTLSGRVSIVDTTSGAVVWEGEFSSTRSGVDNLVDPHPSAHALPFFSTFVDAWPKPQP